MNEFYPDWELSIEDVDNYCFEIREHLSNKIITSIINTKEKAFRAKLISMGWTPPAKGEGIMKLIIEKDDCYIDTGVIDLDGNPLHIHNMDGFGSTDICINADGGLTWKQVDILKKAIALAEKHWRLAKENE